MPAAVTKPLNEQEEQELQAIMLELSSRGIEVKKDLKSLINPEPVKNLKFRRSSNGYFIRDDGWIYNPCKQQADFISSQARYVLAVTGRGGGKALAIDTPILTQNRGWSTMGELKVGDFVFDEAGKPAIIHTKSDVMYNHKCYSVRFSDGSEIIADAEHLWYTQNKKERNGSIRSCGKVRTTEEMIHNLTIGLKKEKNYSIVACKPVQYSEVNLPLHPYILGAWLGDGTSAGSGFTTEDTHILEIFESLGLYSHKYNSNRTCDYSLHFPNSDNTRDGTTGRMLSSPNNLVNILRKLGVLNNKRIPREYLTASVYQRIDLLSGLMDTDGYVDNRGHCEFTTTSRSLFDGTLELCLGLGIKAGYSIGRATIYGKDCGKKYRIYINTELPIFKLDRKLSRLNNAPKQSLRHTQRFIESIEEVPSVPVQCIGVDSSNHLYLAGRTLIATHNTGGGAQKAMAKIAQGEDGAVINPIFSDFKTSTWPEFKRWIDWNMVVPSQKHRKSDAWSPHQPFTMVFVNGAKVYCKGLKDPKSARGANINWLWYDEAASDPTGLSWRIAIASVRIGKNPQAWATTTPKGTEHWVYKFFIKKEIPQEALDLLEKDDRILIDVFRWSVEDNKHNLDPMFYASIIAAFPSGWLRAQEVDGEFANEGGKLGDRRWFDGKIRDEAPEKVDKKVRFWDLAATEKKQVSDDPDESVGTLLSKRHDLKIKKDLFCMEHQVAGCWAWEKLLEAIANTARHDGAEVPVVLEEEPGSGGKNQVAAVKDYFKKFPELAYHKVIGQRARDVGDRVMAANHWFGLASEGRVELLKGLWNDKFLSQLDAFPTPEIHDDRVTSVSGAFHSINPFRSWVKVPFFSVGGSKPR